MTVKLTIEITTPITKKDHNVLRNATMALLSIANEEIGIITPPDDAEGPVEEPVPPATPNGGVN
jgi:hypothetical protein